MSEGRYCTVVISAVALALFVVVMRLLPNVVASRGWDLCDPNNCNLQSWLGATSGWFGGLVAAVAAILLVRQLRSQQIQTAFAIGDAEPTMDAIQHLSDSSELVIRIVNWNRRGIILHSLYSENADVFILPNRVVVDGVEKPVDKIVLPPTPIGGWEDRNRAPHFAEIRVAAFLDSPMHQVQTWGGISKIFASIQMLGDSHKLLELSANTRPIVGETN